MEQNDEELERALAGISGDLDAQPQPEPREERRAEAPRPAAAVGHGNLKDVRKSILVDLQPIATSIKLPNGKKFELLMQIYDTTKDQKLIELAYQTARALDNESERADALLRVIREIDAIG